MLGTSSVSTRLISLVASVSVWSSDARSLLRPGRDLVERQLVDLVEDARQLRLQVDEVARHHGQLGRAAGRDDARLGGLREIVERDVELAGQEASGPKLRTQAPLVDHALQEGVAPLVVPLQHLLDPRLLRGIGDREQALRIEGDHDARCDARLVRLEVEPDVDDLADLDAEVGHGRADGEPAQRLVEAQHVRARHRVARLHRDVPVGVEREDRVGRCDRGVVHERRRVERNAADQQRGERLGAHVEAVRVEGDVEAAHAPEARAQAHELVVGGIDERLDLDRLAVGRQVEADDLADRKPPVVDRRSRRKRAQVVRLQRELAPELARDEGSLVEPDELGALDVGRPAWKPM
jgi:hypothetical protein